MNGYSLNGISALIRNPFIVLFWEHRTRKYIKFRWTRTVLTAKLYNRPRKHLPQCLRICTVCMYVLYMYVMHGLDVYSSQCAIICTTIHIVNLPGWHLSIRIRRTHTTFVLTFIKLSSCSGKLVVGSLTPVSVFWGFTTVMGIRHWITYTLMRGLSKECIYWNGIRHVWSGVEHIDSQ